MTPPSLEAMDATMVSRLEELLRTAPSWVQLLRACAKAKAWGVPNVLCLAPTICTGMCGGGGCAELLEGAGAGRMGGGFLEGS